MHHDLQEIMEVYDGQRKQTNDLRFLIDTLVKGDIPLSWNRFVYCSFAVSELHQHMS